MFKRRDATCLFGGNTCSYVLICTKFYSFISFSSDFLFPIFSQYPMSDSGGARHLRERIIQIHCISLLLGTCLIQCGTLYSLSTCHPSLGILVVSFGLLWLVDVLCYLTLFMQVHSILSQLKTKRQVYASES